MIELLRNCTHKSEISVLLKTDEGGQKKIIKAASTKEGVDNLKREVEGWKWYQKRNNIGTEEDYCNVIINNKSYMRIQIRFIDGIKYDLRKSLKQNSHIIAAAIEHYCKIWPVSEKGMAPLHGDYSIENIITDLKGINVIDWEHFQDNAVPWGFDVLYLLFEALWYNIRLRKIPSDSEVDIITQNIRYLKRFCNHDDIFRNPLSFIIFFMTNNAILWGGQINKFPILNYNPEQVHTIDNMVGKRL